MVYKKTGRQPGRPKKNPITTSTPEMAEDYLTEVSHSDTQTVEEPAVLPPKPVFPFTDEEKERIRTCDDLYLVTKNAARLDNGGHDKQIHNMAWLKDVF